MTAQRQALLADIKIEERDEAMGGMTIDHQLRHQSDRGSYWLENALAAMASSCAKQVTYKIRFLVQIAMHRNYGLDVREESSF